MFRPLGIFSVPLLIFMSNGHDERDRFLVLPLRQHTGFELAAEIESAVADEATSLSVLRCGDRSGKHGSRRVLATFGGVLARVRDAAADDTAPPDAAGEDRR